MNGFYGYQIDTSSYPKQEDRDGQERGRPNNQNPSLIPGVVISEPIDRPVVKNEQAVFVPFVPTPTEKVPTLPQIEPVEVRVEENRVKIDKDPGPKRGDLGESGNDDDDEDLGDDDLDADEDVDDYKDGDEDDQAKFKRSHSNKRRYKGIQSS